MNEDELLYKMIFEEVVKRYTNQNFNVRKLLHEQNGLSGLISLEKLHKFFSQNKFDVEEFLNKNGMDINILRGKIKTGFLLYLTGYFIHNENKLSFKDIFPKEFIPILKEDGELSGLFNSEQYEKFVTNIDACKIDAWLENASIFEKIRVRISENAINVELGEILNDDEIKANKDLIERFYCFREKALKFNIPEDELERLLIHCDWRKDKNGRWFCNYIIGTNNVDYKCITIKFDNGKISYETNENYHSEIDKNIVAKFNRDFHNEDNRAAPER